MELFFDCAFSERYCHVVVPLFSFVNLEIEDDHLSLFSSLKSHNVIKICAGDYLLLLLFVLCVSVCSLVFFLFPFVKCSL